MKFRGSSSKTETREMAAILRKHGYNPKEARDLNAEGMGPEELKQRIQTGGSGSGMSWSGMGSLAYTHGVGKFKAPKGKSRRRLRKAVKRGSVRRHRAYRSMTRTTMHSPHYGSKLSALRVIEKAVKKATRALGKALKGRK